MIESPIRDSLGFKPVCGSEGLEDSLRERWRGAVREGFAVVVRWEAGEVVD